MTFEIRRPPATWIARFQVDPRLHARMKSLIRAKKTTMFYLMPEIIERGVKSLEEQMEYDNRRS